VLQSRAPGAHRLHAVSSLSKRRLHSKGVIQLISHVQ
jgi:hypothetical protein